MNPNVLIEGSQLNDSYIASLPNFFSNYPELTGLILKGPSERFTLIGMARLSHLLTDENNDIGFVEINNIDVNNIHFLNFLSHNEKVDYLSLSSNQIDDDAIEKMCDKMNSNGLSPVTIFIIKDNPITGKGLQSLLGVKSIEELQIKNAELGDLAPFPPNFQAYPDMLFLMDCKLTDEGIFHLSNFLETNATVIHLVLDGNEISNIGLTHIANMLHKNKTIAGISISRNPIENLNPIIDALSFNGSLHSIASDFHEEEIQELEFYLERNMHNSRIKALTFAQISWITHWKNKNGFIDERIPSHIVEDLKEWMEFPENSWIWHPTVNTRPQKAASVIG